MPGGMGKNSRSKKSYKGTCEEVDVKVFGSKDAKKHSKRIHHRAIRAEGKIQEDLATQLPVNEMVCVSVSVYRDALTRGKQYTVLSVDYESSQVRVKDDKGRTRWFPAYCFGQRDRSVPKLVTFHFDDPISSHEDLPVEVTVELSNGERRWCIFSTPAALEGCGEWIEGTQVPFHYGNRHIIIAKELSEDFIRRMLHHIDNQGELMKCTLPLEPVYDKL